MSKLLILLLITPFSWGSYLDELISMAERGDSKAQALLGVKYDDGDGFPKNDSEAIKWYLKAANQGEVNAQVFLGVKYDNGEGVAKNDEEAIRWYRKAADQGDAFSAGILRANFGEGISELQP
mgnify:FL=1